MCMESGGREKRQQTDKSDMRKEILYGPEAKDAFFPFLFCFLGGLVFWGWFFFGGGEAGAGVIVLVLLFLKGKKPLAGRCWCCCCEVLHQPNELALTVWHSKVARGRWHTVPCVLPILPATPRLCRGQPGPLWLAHSLALHAPYGESHPARGSSCCAATWEQSH